MNGCLYERNKRNAGITLTIFKLFFYTLRVANNSEYKDLIFKMFNFALSSGQVVTF